MAKAGAGKFEEAHKIFVDNLGTNPMNVTFQVAAARNLQEWSDNKNAELLQKAWAGSDPDAKGANAIWGWNRISLMTQKRNSEESFRQIYFDARYNLALCQRYIGLSQSDATARKKELNKALSVVRQTKILYPNLGTPEFKTKFEQLEAELQIDISR